MKKNCTNIYLGEKKQGFFLKNKNEKDKYVGIFILITLINKNFLLVVIKNNYIEYMI